VWSTLKFCFFVSNTPLLIEGLLFPCKIGPTRQLFPFPFFLFRRRGVVVLPACLYSPRAPAPPLKLSSSCTSAPPQRGPPAASYSSAPPHRERPRCPCSSAPSHGVCSSSTLPAARATKPAATSSSSAPPHGGRTWCSYSVARAGREAPNPWHGLPAAPRSSVAIQIERGSRQGRRRAPPRSTWTHRGRRARRLLTAPRSFAAAQSRQGAGKRRGRAPTGSARTHCRRRHRARRPPDHAVVWAGRGRRCGGRWGGQARL
jgi:hypothetical protein